MAVEADRPPFSAVDLKNKAVSWFAGAKRTWSISSLIICWILLSNFGWLAVAQPAEVTGRIINGTTGKPLADFEFQLLAMDKQGLQPVKTLRTDAQGNFAITGVDNLLKAPHLLQAEYLGVTYNHLIRPSGTLKDIELGVFETTDAVQDIKVTLPHMMVRREGDLLRLDEVYQVENASRKTYVSKEGFRFYLSPNIAKLNSVSVLAPGSNMPIAQKANQSAAGQGYSIANPIRPGRTQIQISYEMSYAGNRASVAKKFFYPIGSFNLFLSPEDIQAKSNLLKDTTTESTGFRTLSGTDIPADTEVSIELTGGSSREPDAPAGTKTGMGESAPMTSSSRNEERVFLMPPAIARYRALILVNVALLLAAFVGWRLTAGETLLEAKAAQQLKKGGSRGRLLKQRDALLDQVAELDEQWEARSVPEADYRQKRQALKHRLEELTFALEASSPSHSAASGQKL
jgi:hypothetical protein